MAKKKIIAVVGATGAQGGGLVRAILSDESGGFTARAITRDVNSDKAKELAKLGAEVVAADVDDVESLKRAFRGAYGAYCVTFFWAHFSPEKELAEATHMAQAAKHAGLEHVIWSTLEDTRQWVPLSDNRMPTLMGKYKVPHFDAKGEANHVFTDLGLPDDLPADIVLLGQLDLLRHGPQEGAGRQAGHHDAHGRQEAAGHRRRGHRPMRLRHLQEGPRAHRQDGGHCRRAFDRRADGRRVQQGAGQEVRYNDVPPEVYRSFGFPGRRGSRQHVPVQARFRTGTSAARATSRPPEPLTPRCKPSMRGSPGTRPESP